LVEIEAPVKAATVAGNKEQQRVLSEVSSGRNRLEKKPEKKPEAFTEAEGPND